MPLLFISKFFYRLITFIFLLMGRKLFVAFDNKVLESIELCQQVGVNKFSISFQTYIWEYSTILT